MGFVCAGGGEESRSLIVNLLPVTILISSSWLRWLDELSDKLELAELNGWSDGQGDGGFPVLIRLPLKRENVW